MELPFADKILLFPGNSASAFRLMRGQIQGIRPDLIKQNAQHHDPGQQPEPEQQRDNRRQGSVDDIVIRNQIDLDRIEQCHNQHAQ